MSENFEIYFQTEVKERLFVRGFPLSQSAIVYRDACVIWLCLLKPLWINAGITVSKIIDWLKLKPRTK